MKWICFEAFISFLEMLTSCFFATRILGKEIKIRKDLLLFLGYAVGGTVLLVLREIGVLDVVDCVPEILIFSSYSLLVCKTKWWSAVLWAMINYLLIGIVSVTTSSILSIVQGVPMNMLIAHTDGRIMACVLIRLMQLLFSELILIVMKKFQKSRTTHYNDLALVISVSLSIIALMLIWNEANLVDEEAILFINIFICILFLLLNFGLLIFKEILYKEKFNNKELKVQNQLISMQIRNQNEVNEMYFGMRALKHDINNHLHSISGYIQVGEYDKAENYIQKIIGEVASIKNNQSGNSIVDALINSKTNLAETNGIKVDVEMNVPNDIHIEAEHLTIVLGNLYDNAIDANLKIKEHKERYIKIEILFRDKNLLIYFENAAEGEDKENKSLWTTSKKNTFMHGFGLKNIDRIVLLYDGYCERRLENNVFICRIRIPEKDVNNLR